MLLLLKSTSPHRFLYDCFEDYFHIGNPFGFISSVVNAAAGVLIVAEHRFFFAVLNNDFFAGAMHIFEGIGRLASQYVCENQGLNDYSLTYLLTFTFLAYRYDWCRCLRPVASCCPAGMALINRT